MLDASIFMTRFRSLRLSGRLVGHMYDASPRSGAEGDWGCFALTCDGAAVGTVNRERCSDGALDRWLFQFREECLEVGVTKQRSDHAANLGEAFFLATRFWLERSSEVGEER